MSLIESRDILNKLCSNDYYRGDDVQCAIQCLAEGKAINRVRTLEDVGQTVIDEKLKDRLMKSKDKGNAFDDVNWKWLLSLLLFLSTLEPPKRREITISAKSNSKSVTITYDPSDAEAVKAAEVWREALFVKTSEAAPKNGNCIYASDKVRYALDAIAYLSGNFKGQHTYIPLTTKQREAIDALYEDLHSREPLDAANLFKPGSYEPKDLPTAPNRMTELEKASKPLRAYPKAHGDPHTSVIVTQYGATKTQDEPAAPEPEPDKLDYDPLHDTLIDPLPFEYLCYWEQIAQEYSKVREAWDNGKRARIPRHITSFLSILSKRLSKDQEEAMKAMLRKPDATAPKVDLQELDRAIRALSGVVKDDQSGLQTHFDGVNMSYVLECLKQFREAAT